MFLNIITPWRGPTPTSNAIEEHASPQSIERAFIKEVRQSDLLILLLDQQLRDAVEKEFLEACSSNTRIFVYIRNTDKRDDRLAAFIGQQAYRFHCGSFNSPVDLCPKIRNDILSDLTHQYFEAAKIEKPDQDYVVVSKKGLGSGHGKRMISHRIVLK